MHGFHHSTGTINFSVALVQFALALYVLEKSHFPTKKIDVIEFASHLIQQL
jgi:hypothetical protein